MRILRVLLKTWCQCRRFKSNWADVSWGHLDETTQAA